MEDAQLLGILVKNFQLQCFKDWQLKTIKAVLKEKDTFVNHPTDSGKSLTFQFPPLVTRHLSFVITPTISLMIDQAEQLQQRELRAIYLGSCQPDTDVYNKITAKAFNVTFLTPESLFDVTDAPRHFFKCLAKEGMLGLIAIDKVHLVPTGKHSGKSLLNYREISHGH